MSGVRHSSATIAEARELARGGWSAYAIAQILQRRGTRVSEGTVRTWVDPRHAERRRLAQRQRMNQSRARGLGAPWMHVDATPEYKAARLRALADAGVGPAHIARVLTLDFGAEVTENMVRNALASGSVPSPWKRAATGGCGMSLSASRREEER